jgi:hypothetical protein
MNQDLKLSQLNKEIEREFLTPFFINIDLSMYKIISNISLIIGALATGTIFFNDFLLIGLFLSFCLDLAQAESWEDRLQEISISCELN